MEQKKFNEELMSFINASPTAFHAVSNMCTILSSAGFEELRESEAWDIGPGRKYFVTRNDSSIIAFSCGRVDARDTGFRMLGAHTDSPALKVKPDPLFTTSTYMQLGVEVYGGALLHPWFDRDLSMAGRVSFIDNSGECRSLPVDFKRPVALVPSLAIHLNRDANTGGGINAQKDLPVIIGMNSQEVTPAFSEILKEQLELQYGKGTVKTVLDHDIFLYDCQRLSFAGLSNEFITGARLDNLVSCFTGIRSILSGEGNVPFLLACNDHEETGSLSFHGAQGPFLRNVLERIYRDREDFLRVIDRSMLVSMDNAHGVHPNYSEKSDNRHAPLLNGGPVIKLNANQRYASNSETSAVFRSLALALDVPVQNFVMRSDMPCGSTIGPVTAGELGVRTVDVGIPTIAMHSIRETAGSMDAYSLFLVTRAFLNRKSI